MLHTRHVRTRGGGGGEMLTKILVRKYHLEMENLCVDGRRIMKWIL